MYFLDSSDKINDDCELSENDAGMKKNSNLKNNTFSSITITLSEAETYFCR